MILKVGINKISKWEWLIKALEKESEWVSEWVRWWWYYHVDQKKRRTYLIIKKTGIKNNFDYF